MTTRKTPPAEPQEPDVVSFDTPVPYSLVPVPSSPPETPTYEEVWIVTEYEGGGIRGVFVSQGDAEAEIVAICSEHRVLTRRDFTIAVYRVRRRALPVVQDEAPKAEDDSPLETIRQVIASLRDVVSVGRFAPAVNPARFCSDLALHLESALGALGASRPSPAPKETT